MDISKVFAMLPGIFIVMAVAIMMVTLLVWFFRLPKEDQIQKIKEWLLWAVTDAEREFGGGTGQIKLRSVYDMFVVRFPGMAKVISFSRFSELVDEALVRMRKMLAENAAAQEYVSGKDGTYNG